MGVLADPQILVITRTPNGSSSRRSVSDLRASAAFELANIPGYSVSYRRSNTAVWAEGSALDLLAHTSVSAASMEL